MRYYQRFPREAPVVLLRGAPQVVEKIFDRKGAQVIGRNISLLVPSPVRSATQRRTHLLRSTKSTMTIICNSTRARVRAAATANAESAPAHTQIKAGS
jgi:hypothetical protein